MKLSLVRCFLLLVCVFKIGLVQSIEAEFDQFDQIYKAELGSTQGCQQPELGVFRVCSEVLRNDGNAPFILHHGKVTPKVMVLFHGLSDSPFYLKSIAQALYNQGHNVVVALLPGHGLKNADLHMQDYALSDHWRTHVSTIMDFSVNLGEQSYMGGFSTGGVLATEYMLLNPEASQGLLLFSGALALQPNIETLTSVWGIQWLMKILDGEYTGQGTNPYKYSSVARFAAGELMEVITSVRDLIRQNKPNMPIFAAHSEADITIPIEGVKNLLAENSGESVSFFIDRKLDVCHADLVINQQQAQAMQSDTSSTDIGLGCNGPKANPEHVNMLKAMLAFVDQH
ncbi:lysophospholipase [Paraglaciecola aquimarina]|uniref:Lysophospholipase n=1 Tax=Paraglaciecola algarum TaxID=3050085 RepID=A0ABS9D6U7_9ALTE|nr:alpha/beta hydrolase [Paraglaciecola sp. G1-23]MCF2948673.1 lysophospholipase [Paraglaciecola sp. G1-23]